MPAHDRVGRHDRRHAVQQAPAKLLALRCESAALVVGQPQLPTPELLLQYAVLLDQVLDRALLLAVHPAGDGQQQRA